MTFLRRDRPSYASAPLFRQLCARCIRTCPQERVRTSSQKLICCIAARFCEAPSHSALKTKGFQRAGPAGHLGCSRQMISKTNHLQPGRRRCFYLAILFPTHPKRPRTIHLNGTRCSVVAITWRRCCEASAAIAAHQKRRECRPNALLPALICPLDCKFTGPWLAKTTRLSCRTIDPFRPVVLLQQYRHA